MSDRQCRWGILGTATIARKNWQAIRNSGNSALVAVASRDVDRSRTYIDECQSCVPFDPVPRAMGSYDELLASDEIDAVYIPLPTGLRKPWVIRAAEAGKHVLCEKPCGVSTADVEEMVAACERNNVQFMDGVMFMHSRRLDRLREVLDDGTSVGRIKRITSQFSFFAPDDWVRSNIRTVSDLEPAGCLGDLGWYNIRFALWVMNGKVPQRVSGRMLSDVRREGSAEATPTEFSGELFFDGGVSSSFYCSFETEHQQWANVSGTRGHVIVPDFVLPYFGSEAAFDLQNPVFELNGCDFNMCSHSQRIPVAEYSNNAPNAQETLLFRNFADLVLSGTPDPVWPKLALDTQRIMDACLTSARNNSQPVEL